MYLKAVPKTFLAIGLIFFYAFFFSTARAQEDPNSQYVTLLSGKLSGETREIEVPVEVSVFRVFFSVRSGGEIKLDIISPVGRPISLEAPNISVANDGGKQTVSMWDPRPGLWKMRLTGSGDFAATASVQSELYICCLQFFSRNQITQLDKLQPVRGSKHQAQVYVSGFNIDKIEFLLVSEQGEIIAPLKLRQSDFSNPYNYTLLLDVPDLPFRILARGSDLNGKRFQRVFFWLVRPAAVETVNAQPDVPIAGTAAPPAADWDKNAISGEYKIVRAQVVEWSDELLLSEKGNPIGLRLKFAIRFPVDGQYSPYPQAFPERITSAYTGALSLRVHRSTVEPLPEGLQQPQQMFFSGRPAFKSGVVYRFSVDLIPSYANYNDQKKSFCLMTKSYNQQGIRERFEREVTSATRFRYRLSFSGTDLEGRTPVLTENTYSPAVWHRGFIKDGVTECQ